MIDTIEPGEPATIEVPFQLRRRGVEIRLVLRAEGAEAPDDKLVALVARSHRWLDQLTSGAIASIREIAQAEGIDGGDVSRFLPLACHWTPPPPQQMATGTAAHRIAWTG